MNDFRFAFRSLRQNPAFALTAMVSIGLAVGAGSTIFAFYDGLLFRPLPVPNASEILTLSTRTPSGVFGDVSYAYFSDFRRLNHSFSGLIASRLTSFGFAKDKNEQPRMKAGLLASGNLFDTLKIQPVVGRTFRPDEDQAPGRDAVAVLAYSFWRDEFAADPNIGGRHMLLNGLDFTIVGIAPESFSGLDQFFHPAFFVPAMMTPALDKTAGDLLTDRAHRAFTVKGRVRPGVSLSAAKRGGNRSGPISGAIVPKNEWRLRRDRAHGDAGPSRRSKYDAILAALLFAPVAVVLLIACANIANLLLGRGHRFSIHSEDSG
jgi:hypothetical protein